MQVATDPATNTAQLGPTIEVPRGLQPIVRVLGRIVWALVVWLFGRPLGTRIPTVAAGIAESAEWSRLKTAGPGRFLHSPAPLFSLALRFCDQLGSVFHRPPGPNVLQLLLAGLYAGATWAVCRSLYRLAPRKWIGVCAAVLSGLFALEMRNVLWTGLVLPDSLSLSLFLYFLISLLAPREDSLFGTRQPIVFGVLLALCGMPFAWFVGLVSIGRFVAMVRQGPSDIESGRKERFGMLGLGLGAFTLGFFLLLSADQVAGADQEGVSFVNLGRTLASRFIEFDVWGVRYRANIRAADMVGTLSRIVAPSGQGFWLIWPSLSVLCLVRLALLKRATRHSGSATIGLAVVAYLISAFAVSPEGMWQRSFVPFSFALVIFVLATVSSDPTVRHWFGSSVEAPAKDDAPLEDSSQKSRMPIFGSVPPWHSVWPWFITAPLLAVIVVGSTKANEYRSQDYDATPIMEISHRINRFGGTYFTAAADVKGPLYQLVYHLASMLGGRRDAWWVITIFVTINALMTGIAVGAIVWSRNRSRLAATAAGIATYVTLVASKQAFGGLLYARNMTIMLAAVAFAFIATTRSINDYRRPMMAGLCMGIAASTISAEVLLLPILSLWLWQRCRDEFETGSGGAQTEHSWLQIPKPVQALCASAAGAFLVPPVWYLFRGVFGEYWYYWYRYSGFYYSSTRRPLTKVLKHGLSELRLYYLRQPLLGVTAFIFIALMVFAVSKRKTIRWMEFATAGWWLSASITITLAQRFSWHHFVVIVVPVFVMLGSLLDRVLSHFEKDSDADWRIPSTAFVALLSTCVVLGFGTFQNVWRGWRDARKFNGFAEYSRSYVDSLGGDMRTVRAFSEMTSGPDESIFVWASVPWNPDRFGRIPASRFIEKRVLQGNIYLGATSPNYVPPKGWQQLETDLDDSNAALFIENDDELLPDTAPVRKYRDDRYQSVLKVDKWNIRMRKERLAQFLDPTVFASASVGSSTCYETRAVLRNPGIIDASPLSIVAADESRPGSAFVIKVSPTDVIAAFAGPGGEFPQFTNARQLPDGAQIRILAGRRAIALVADGSIVSVMLRATDRHPAVITSSADGVRLEGAQDIPRPDCFGVPE
jgi:hypothetical protein